MQLTPDQLAALTALSAALTLATDSGLFDALCAYVHPDVINGFCDAVAEAEADLKPTEGHTDG